MNRVGNKFIPPLGVKHVTHTISLYPSPPKKTFES